MLSAVSVDIPRTQECDTNQEEEEEEQDIGSVVDGVDFVDRSAAKFSVLSRSASARLTYFVDRSNNTKDGDVSEGSSLNSAVRLLLEDSQWQFCYSMLFTSLVDSHAHSLAVHRVGRLLRTRT